MQVSQWRRLLEAGTVVGMHHACKKSSESVHSIVANFIVREIHLKKPKRIINALESVNSFWKWTFKINLVANHAPSHFLVTLSPFPQFFSAMNPLLCAQQQGVGGQYIKAEISAARSPYKTCFFLSWKTLVLVGRCLELTPRDWTNKRKCWCSSREVVN